VKVVGENLVYNGATIEGLKPIDQGDEKVAYERAPYSFTTEYGETIDMPATNVQPEIKNGKLCIPAHCWDAEAGENGAWVRAHMMDLDETGNEVETTAEVYSLREGMQVLLDEIKKNPNVDRTESKARMRAIRAPYESSEEGVEYFECNGVKMEKYNPVGFYPYRGDTFVYSGSDMKKIESPFYEYIGLREDGRYACMLTEVDGVVHQFPIDYPGLMHSNVGQSLWRLE